MVRRGVYHEYLLTEAVPGAISLHDWLEGHTSDESDSEFLWQRISVARQLGLLLQRLHQQRFDHRDLKPTNLLLSDVGRVWLIDLDGIWRWPVLPRIRRVQNLARLWAGLAGRQQVTAADALRFLLAYLTPEQRGEWKLIWRQVARRAAAKIMKKG
jgi:serine/threonine protein kinase